MEKPGPGRSTRNLRTSPCSRRRFCHPEAYVTVGGLNPIGCMMSQSITLYHKFSITLSILVARQVGALLVYLAVLHGATLLALILATRKQRGN